MQTSLASQFRDTPTGQEADAILRSCVHCGFCNATCPTYQLLGDELDGPRGRIYQIKRLLEGDPATERVRLHLDRCLTCRNCETTCPSGVQYGNLLDIGRELVEATTRRPWRENLLRWMLRSLLPYPRRLKPLLALGRLTRPLLPKVLTENIPTSAMSPPWPAPQHSREVLLLEGCVQSVTQPQINAVTARVLDRLGVTVQRVTGVNCCGAVSFHLTATEEARRFMRRNIDMWWPRIEAGIEAIVVTASACSLMVKDYGRLLRDDPDYAARAARVSELCRDISEFTASCNYKALQVQLRKVAFHAPCTLQHGVRLNGVVERLLTSLGFTLTPVADSQLCCGAAGTYSLLQPELANQLRTNKLAALESDAPDCIATANIGCLLHLRAASQRPVYHWIELLDQ